MTEKDIYCSALYYFHSPQTRSYNTGLLSFTSIPGNPSASAWHMPHASHPPSQSPWSRGQGVWASANPAPSPARLKKVV